MACRWRIRHKMALGMTLVVGIMAVLLSGKEEEVKAAIEFMRSKGVTVEPIEKSVVEG